MVTKKSVLITGCSEGGLGDALARALHNTNHFRVIATARNPSKVKHFKALGIETLPLDVNSADSIAACVKSTAALTNGTLNMLVNNSGGGYHMPLADVDMDKAREVFEPQRLRCSCSDSSLLAYTATYR